MTDTEWFHFYFPLLSGGRKPFAWQRALLQRLLKGDWPRQIDLPTGSGKTSFMIVWLIALAWEARQGSISIPRRLIWVVNRRVVVDQATTEAGKLAERLGELPGGDALRTAITEMSASRRLLAVSTLRGELADNGNWKEDPSGAAIVIGTVDMVGSRLLFSGYGDSAYFRPQHAGLLGVDSVLVNDEAHLTVPFARLLRGIERRNPAEGVPGKQFRFVEMSATHAGEGQEREQKFPESLDEDCLASEIFSARFTTQKKLWVELQPDSKRVDARIFELAIADGASRSIIFIDRPEKARDLCVRLKKQFPGPGQVQLLTGTMRGRERDDLDLTSFGDVVPERRVFLVATSAGEVGVDITADRMITGIAEINRLIQRFGRLDRYGKGGGEAYVVYSTADLKEGPVQKTLEYLKGLGPSFSSQRLREDPPDPEAKEPPVRMAELHPWLIDLWCQTSDPVSGYPKVEDYLHGQQEDLAETELAWRSDVRILADPQLADAEDGRKALQVFPVLARERLREPTSRLVKKLEELASQHPTARVLVRERDGSVTSDLLPAVANRGLALAYTLVLLPLDCGGLEFGMLSSAKGADQPSDVADGENQDRRQRGRHFVGVPEMAEGLPPGENCKELLKIDLAEEGAETESYLLYWQSKRDPDNKKPYLLEQHLEDVRDKARSIAAKLVPELADTFAAAGFRHDTGKGRELWQHCMGRCRGMVVAKSVRAPYPKGLNGYRHELGSLIDLNDADELMLHLIAAHHGHARPNFKPNATDGGDLRSSEAAIRAAPERFARLTARYGPWGLAYLEALLKAADVWASKEGPEDNG